MGLIESSFNAVPEGRRPPPDFVIAGAPKCGTTSIYASLSAHPDVYFSEGIKEPHYFAFDYPKRREVERAGDYDRLFGKADGSQLRGDASVYYLSSSRAIKAILERRPDAKFIAVVRNPLEMFVSIHNENVKALDEDRCLEDAWELQDVRETRKNIPRLCKEPAFLQYRTLCSLGAQIRNLFELVPAAQRLVIVFEDIQRCPELVQKQILNFLGIANDTRYLLSHENAFSRHRYALVARCARLVMVSRVAKTLRFNLKPLLNGVGLRPLAWAARFSLRTVPKPVITQTFRDKLHAAFDDDTRLLQTLLSRDLSHWLSQSPTSHGATSEEHQYQKHPAA